MRPATVNEASRKQQARAMASGCAPLTGRSGEIGSLEARAGIEPAIEGLQERKHVRLDLVGCKYINMGDEKDDN